MRLARAVERQVVIPDRKPHLQWVQQGALLAASAEPQMTVESVNISQLSAHLQRVYRHNEVRLAQALGTQRGEGSGYYRHRTRSVNHNLLQPLLQSEIAVRGTRNQDQRTTIRLLDLWQQRYPDQQRLPPGQYQLTVHDQQSYRSIRQMIHVSDIGLCLRHSGKRLAIWSYHLATGEALSDVRLVVRDRHNQLLATGHTNSDGLALLSLSEYQRPYVVIAERRLPRDDGETGETLIDRCVIDADYFQVGSDNDVLRGRRVTWQDDRLLPEAWLHTDRGIVLPGGEARATAIIRHIDGAVPLGHELSLRWRDPQGQVQFRQDRTCPADGLVTWEMHDTTILGQWHAEVWWRQRRADAFTRLNRIAVEIGSFVPDRIAVQLKQAPFIFNDQVITSTISSHWLTGEPARELSCLGKGQQRVKQLSPRDGFYFNISRGGSDPDLPRRHLLSPARGQLDSNGEATLTFTPLTSLGSHRADSSLHGAQGQESVITCEVFDPSGRKVVQQQVTQIISRHGLLGVRGQQDERGITVDIKRFLDHAEQVAPTQDQVTVSVEQRWWSWQRRRHGSGYRWDHRIERRSIAQHGLQLASPATSSPATSTPATSSASHLFTAAEINPLLNNDHHRWRTPWLVLRVTSEQNGHLAIAEFPLSSPSQSPDQLRLRAPKFKPIWYQPDASAQPHRFLAGSIVPLEISAPFAGQAMLTPRTSPKHIISIPIDIDEGSQIIDLDLPAELASYPTVHVAMHLVRGLEQRPVLHAASWTHGMTAIQIDRSASHLHPHLELPESVASGAAVETIIHAPGATRAIVQVVDYGIINRTNHPATTGNMV